MHGDERDEDEEEPQTDAVELPIEDVLDLHSFRPRDVPDVVREYLDQACARGFPQVRIIHGRGIGMQRAAVRAILERDPRIAAFGDAPAEAGGWGATWARFG